MHKRITRTIASLILLQVMATGYPNPLQLPGEYPKGRDEPATVVAKAAIPRSSIDKTKRPSAEEILTSYESSLAVMRERVSFTAELEQILNGAFQSKAKKYKHKRVIHRDGTRFGLSRESKRFDDQNKMIGHDCLSSIHDTEKAMITQNPYGQPPEHLRIDFRPKGYVDRFLADLGTGRLMDGVTYGAHNKTFFEVISEARSLQLRDKTEIVDEHETYVLEAETKYGKHILWIDPEYGFNARRMAIHKVIGDYDFDTKLGDQPRPLPPNVNPAVPWCATVKSDLTVDNIRIEKVDGRYVPVSAKIRDYEEFEDGQFTEVISNYKRSDIDFNPDFDAMIRNFLEEVPDETKVYVYHEQSSTATYKWQKGQVVDFQGRKVDYKPKKPQSLLGKPLPSLEGFGLGISKVRDSNNIIVICFWDMNQRPSRNCVIQLGKKVQGLKEKKIVIVTVQTSKVDKSTLVEWAKKQNINFPIGMIEGDEDESRLIWGVRSLPWLILTDHKYIVRAEGFGLDELDKKLSETAGIASMDTRTAPTKDGSVSANTSEPSSRQIRVVGVARDRDGKPVAGVEVRRLHGPGPVRTDAGGKFELFWDPARNRPLVDTYYIIARHEQENLSVVVEVPEFEQGTESVNLNLLPGVTFKGKVVDPAGRPIELARVSILLHTPTQGSGLYNTITDSEGMFEFRGIPTDHKYTFAAQASGHGTKWVSGIYAGHDFARKDFELEPMTLAIADQSVSGVVVDAYDKPVSGVHLSTDGEGQPQHYNVRTDAEGKFKIEEVCTGDLRIFATVEGETLLSGYARTYGGATDVRIVLKEVPSPDRRRFVPKTHPSLVGRALPEVKDLGIELSSAQIGGKRMLLCFFDLEQRPSRYFVAQLAKQAGQLKDKDLAVVVVQASKVDQSRLNEWIKDNNIPFPAGMAREDEAKTRITWGVKSLPWLILTDHNHVVTAEGFGLDELDGKIGQTGDGN